MWWHCALSGGKTNRNTVALFDRIEWNRTERHYMIESIRGGKIKFNSIPQNMVATSNFFKFYVAAG
jgi:hypothetical protein